MWRKLRLNTKIILSLLIVQASTLTVGVVWLVHWNESKRLDELAQLLDTESDAVEGALSSVGGLHFDATNEAVRELYEDKHFYFQILDVSGKVVAEAQGPEVKVRTELKQNWSKTAPRYTVALTSGLWVVQSEALHGESASDGPTGTIHVAIDAQPALDDVAHLQRFIVLAACGILLATSVGSGLVVSFSTRNLREFARGIRGLRPPFFDGAPNLAPQSAEESLLFDSFRTMAATVRGSVEAQRLFIAHASHELKSPIAASMSALEVTLSRPRSASDYEATCRAVLGEITVLRRLSTVLLDLARLETPTERREEPITDAVSVIRTVLMRWKGAADSRAASLTFSPDRAIAVVLLPGQPDQWEVVFSNLVDNAIKYGRDGGKVTVTTKGTGDQTVTIDVTDDGRGMSADQIARLGEAFFRGDAARTDSSSFGLGFAHAKRIVEQLGGRIVVESSEGFGTKISILIAGSVATA